MDERFLKEEGAEVFTGNELLFKGALEAGAALLTGYPGSPISEFFDTCFANRELLKKHGIVADLANNEALAVARLNGARMAGVRAMAAMKSVGLHVAADGLALGNLSEPQNEGGAVVVVGDDPWIESTQINNDSRYLSQHLHMPVLEPATFQEMKDWVREAFELSSLSDLYITYLVTTPQADGGGTVWARPNRWPAIHRDAPTTLNTDRIDLDRNVLLPPRTWDREATLPKRFEKLLTEIRVRNLNKLLLPRNTAEVGDEGKAVPSPKPSPTFGGRGDEVKTGFISSGMTYCYLEHALYEMEKTGHFPILKLGLSYPVDPQIVLELAEQVETIIVVEEKRGFVESQVISILHEAEQSGRLKKKPMVWGKKFPGGQDGFPETRGLNPTIVTNKLRELMDPPPVAAGEDGFTYAPISPRPLISLPVLPSRTPTFCPGCPHRDSSSVFLQIKRDFRDPAYMARVHGQAPMDLVFHGETGCFTMLMFEPNEALMHNYSGMGLGGGTGAGADPFITNKQIVFLGDSTFFHSGIVAVSDSVKSGQDVTYVILDNKTTAMTGHQPTPGNDYDLLGHPVRAQKIEAIVRAMAGQGIPVTRLRPDDHKTYRALLERTILEKGVKVVIADKECGLTSHQQKRRERKREIRRQGFVAEERHINVTPDVCEYCLECTKTTGCPGLTVEQTDFGPKIVTDLSSCVSDGACVQVKACPAFEEIVIHRRAPSKKTPSPLVPSHYSVGGHPPKFQWRMGEQQKPFSIFIAGVGGMGAGLLTEILVRSAHESGFRVLFTDKKGLAVRNGAVTSQLLLSREGGVFSPVIPQGEVDLLLGLDALEAARSNAISVSRTAAVVDPADHLTVRMLLGKDPLSQTLAFDRLKANVRPDALQWVEASKAAERYFGNRLYANLILLGSAFQNGYLPMTWEILEKAIGEAVRPEDRQDNLQAFRLGRRLVVEPTISSFPAVAGGESINKQKKLMDPLPVTAGDDGRAKLVIDEKIRRIRSEFGDEPARQYRFWVGETLLLLNLGDAAHRDLALRAYELLRYENPRSDRKWFQAYLAVVTQTFQRDRAAWGYRATRAVIHNAFRVMAIKDEVYVADLLTRPEKRERDAARYGIDASNGDRVTYRHFTCPEFVLWGKAFRWDMISPDWALTVMKRLTVLRTWLPGWHARERYFRDLYRRLLQAFDPQEEKEYETWLSLLRRPEDIKGYREIRYPKMEEAIAVYERYLTKSADGRRESHAPASEPLRR